MKYYIFILISSIILLIQGSLIAQTYQLDSKTSTAQWTGYGEIGSFEQTGDISILDGTCIVEDGELRSGKIRFDMKSISHEDKQLKKHLKAKDFFDVNKYPEASFILETVAKNLITGTLNLRGKQHVESFEIDIIKTDNIIQIQGTIRIDRTKYDIKYNSSTYFQDLGNYAIKNEIDLKVSLVFKNQ